MLAVTVAKDAGVQAIVNLSVSKHQAFDSSFGRDDYLLLYKHPAFVRVDNTPGSDLPFTLEAYKEFTGSEYGKMSFLLCSELHYNYVNNSDVSLQGSSAKRQVSLSSDEDSLPGFDMLSSSLESSNSSTATNYGAKRFRASTVHHAATRCGTPSTISGDTRSCTPRYCTPSTLSGSPVMCSPSTVPASARYDVCQNQVSSFGIPRPPILALRPSGSYARPASVEESSYTSYLSLLQSSSDEDEDLQIAINASLHTATPKCKSSVDEVLGELSNLVDDSNAPTQFNISRRNLWDCTKRSLLRATFCPTSRISVKFMDDVGTSEGAVDQGGPKREFLQLLIDHVNHKGNCFVGPHFSKHLTLVQTAMSNDDYRLSGVATAISIVHGGASPKCLSRYLFQALVDGPDQVTVHVDDMPDGDLKSDLFKMITCNTVEEANEVAEQLTTIMEMCGCSTVLKELKDFGTLANTISTWFCLGRTRPAFDRFICGLGTLGVLDSIRQHPDVFQPLLCYTERKVTRDEMVALFSPVLSRQGSNKRAKENDIYGWFMDLLQDCAEQNGPLDLEDILFFATGSRQIHPLGFTSKPELTFMHDNATSGITSSLYPMANTCSCVLRLPVAHNSYDEFKEHFVFAVKNAQGFGFS